MNKSDHCLRPDTTNPMGGPTLEVLQIGRILARRSSPRSIDLGGGTGRNSIHLATIGFDSTLVEMEADLCKDAEARASECGISLNVQQRNVMQSDAPGPFDLVLALGILHFLSTDDALRLIALYRRLTTRGGVHIVTISPPSTDPTHSNTLLGQGYLGSVARDSLTQAYGDWPLVGYERYVKTDDHLGYNFDTHVIEKFIFSSDQHSEVGEAAERIHLTETGDLDGKEGALLEHLRNHTSRERFRALYGDPDFMCLESGSVNDLGLIQRANRAFELCVAFWGHIKCYFENDRLVGFSHYASDVFHAFK